MIKLLANFGGDSSGVRPKSMVHVTRGNKENSHVFRHPPLVCIDILAKVSIALAISIHELTYLSEQASYMPAISYNISL